MDVVAQSPLDSLFDLSNLKLFLLRNLPNAFLIQVENLGVGVLQLRYLLQCHQTLSWPVHFSLILLLASIFLHLENPSCGPSVTCLSHHILSSFSVPAALVSSKNQHCLAQLKRLR